MFFSVCVRLTTNGVVVRHQVLSSGWGSNTCQLKFGESVQLYSSWQETAAEENICSCVSIDPISNAGLVLYCVTHGAGNLP